MLLIVAFTSFLGNVAFAQKQGQELIDSLLAELPKAKEDTNKVNLLNALSYSLQYSNTEKGFNYSRQGLKLAETLNWQKGIARSIILMGTHSSITSDYTNSLEYLFKGLKMTEDLNDKVGIAQALTGLGLVYTDLSQYSNALEYILKALKLREELGNKKGIAGCLSNIGVVYYYQKDYPKSFEYYFKALKINREINNRDWEAVNLCNIGEAYKAQSNYIKALEYNYNSLKINEELNNKIGMANNYSIMADAYLMLATDSNKAQLKELFRGNKTKALQQAILYGNMAVNFYKELDDEYFLSNTYKTLSESQQLLGDNKAALESYKLYTAAKDSIFNIEKDKKLTQSAMQYEFDKKEAAAKAEQEKKDVLAQKELQRQKLMRNGFIAGFVIVLLFAGVFFRQRNKIKKQRQRAERSEQFKQQFLANMSHEIRTPMNAIIGMTNLALETPLNTKQKNYLTVVRKSSENLLHIINEILDLSKIEAGKMELEQIDFSLREVVDQVKQTLQHKASEKDIELIATIDTNVPDVLIGDPVRLFQVLMNLAGNAVKFTEKGSVQISVNMENTQQIKFAVIDTGIGIPADKIDKIFESFSQAHTSDTRNFGGTGLGLTISKQLVELMGGNITIESELGSGSSFSFGLNLKHGSAENLKKQTEEIDGSTLNGLKVLLVDDNEDNRIVCRDTLETKSKVEIIEATNGKEALEKLSQQEFDIVLMDVQMPVMDGYEATRQIRGMKNNIPIIALTASVIRSDLDKCRAAGMNDYVPKPFKPSQLFAAIAKLTGREFKLVQQTAPTTNTHIAVATQHTDLTYLKNFCEGNEAKMQKYIKIFLDSIPAFIEKLNAAQSENNFEDIASQAHGFKTKFVMMGMEEARLLAAQLEIDCRTENTKPTIIHKNTTALIRIILAAEDELKNRKVSFTP